MLIVPVKESVQTDLVVISRPLRAVFYRNSICVFLVDDTDGETRGSADDGFRNMLFQYLLPTYHEPDMTRSLETDLVHITHKLFISLLDIQLVLN